jgi:GxxExxY protein
MRLRIPTPLPLEIEEIVQRIIGAAIEVHRQLGPGLRERLYEAALKLELKHLGLRFDCQRRVIVEYRSHRLPPQWLDMVVEDCVVVELKAVERLLPVHQAQVLSYLRSTGLRIGLLFNFNCETLQTKRVVL